MEENSIEPTELIRECCQALDDKKALDVRLLNMTGVSSITNYFVIATATSDPHLRALRRNVEVTLEKHGQDIVGVDYHPDSGWMCIDAFDFMVHLFTEQQRGNYRLEDLWKDAEEVPVAEMLTA